MLPLSLLSFLFALSSPFAHPLAEIQCLFYRHLLSGHEGLKGETVVVVVEAPLLDLSQHQFGPLLQDLHVYDLALTGLSRPFASIAPTLTNLLLCNNSLSYFPAEINLLVKLQSLYLYNQSIGTLDIVLPRLETLVFINCSVTAFSSRSAAPKLERLSWIDQELKVPSFPASLKRLTSLENLEVQVSLRNVDISLFNHLAVLRTLILCVQPDTILTNPGRLIFPANSLLNPNLFVSLDRPFHCRCDYFLLPAQILNLTECDDPALASCLHSDQVLDFEFHFLPAKSLPSFSVVFHVQVMTNLGGKITITRAGSEILSKDLPSLLPYHFEVELAGNVENGDVACLHLLSDHELKPELHKLMQKCLRITKRGGFTADPTVPPSPTPAFRSGGKGVILVWCLSLAASIFVAIVVASLVVFWRRRSDSGGNIGKMMSPHCEMIDI